MRSRPPARPAHLAGRRACLRACPPAACRSKPGSSRGRRCSARYAGCTGSEPASARQRPVTRTAAAPAARTAQRRSRPTAQSPDRSNGTLGARSIILFIVFLIFVRCVAGGDRCGAAFAEQRVAAAGANGEMRARRVGGDRLVQQPMRELVLEAVDREHGIDADVVEQWSRDVRGVGDRLPEPLFVRCLAPRTALSEDRRVIVPRAQPALVPHEVVAHAAAATDRALQERLRRVRERVENVFGKVFRVDDHVLDERFRDGCRPTDPRQQLQLAQRRDERALVEDVVVNPEDLPEDVLDALSHAAESLVQCAICRRSCVRDHFVWNERRLCAWDYHATVFGKRGPWREAPYEERLWETIPDAAYVAGPLLDDVRVDAVLAIDGLDDELAHRLLNEAIAADPARPHLAVRTSGGYTLLRERGAAAIPAGDTPNEDQKNDEQDDGPSTEGPV